MCSGTAVVNIKLHKLVATEIGLQYKVVLCPNHRYETAINTAFKKPKLNETSQTEHKNIYYLFKKTPMK